MHGLANNLDKFHAGRLRCAQRRRRVADQLARVADQDRRGGRQPCLILDIPNGRGRAVAEDVERAGPLAPQRAQIAGRICRAHATLHLPLSNSGRWGDPGPELPGIRETSNEYS